MAWQGLLGIPVIFAVAWALGTRERRIPWRIVVGGLGLQVALAVLLLWLPPAREVFSAVTVVVENLQKATLAGTSFVFGYVGGFKNNSTAETGDCRLQGIFAITQEPDSPGTLLACQNAGFQPTIRNL